MSKSAYRGRAAAALLLALPSPALASDGPWGRSERVTRDELRAAMREETGYDATATTNVGRFQGNVLLRLVRWARERQPEGPPLFVDYDDWFRVLLESQGLSEEQAPVTVRLTHQHQQSTWLDDRPGHVVKRVITGPEPRLAVNVISRFPEDTGLPERYSYEDTLSRPELQVTVRSRVRYRLLDLGDSVVFDEIDGIYGRPTTGLLAVFFKLLGEARAVRTRMAFAPDGWHVVVGKGRKGFISKTATVTIAPDGSAEPGIPAGRPDLGELAGPLQEAFEVEYAPWTEDD